MTVWSRALICDRSVPVIAGLDPAEVNLVFVVCCVGSGLCDELIIRAEDSCRVCVCMYVCLTVCNSETYKMAAYVYLSCCATEINVATSIRN
jgi:hypothetical protein